MANTIQNKSTLITGMEELIYLLTNTNISNIKYAFLAEIYILALVCGYNSCQLIVFHCHSIFRKCYLY